MTIPTQLCTRCGKRPRLGTLSRCKLCLKAETAADLRLDKKLERQAAKDWQAPLTWDDVT